jgi:hypothetical protein
MQQTDRTVALALPRQRELSQRALHMALAWATFGVAVGLLTAPSRDAIALVSGVLAGLIVLCPLGAILGLLGGQVKPALAGGMAGGVLGALGALLLAPPGLAFVVSVGLVGGGLAGASSSAVFWWVRLLVRFGTAPDRRP